MPGPVGPNGSGSSFDYIKDPRIFEDIYDRAFLSLGFEEVKLIRKSGSGPGSGPGSGSSKKPKNNSGNPFKAN